MYITNALRDDGFGAQYQTVIFTILYAGLYNLEFVYTPFTSIAHNYDNDELFLEKKEKFINIKNNYKSVREINPKKLINVPLQKIYWEVEQRLDLLLNSDSFKKISELFYNNKTKSDENIMSVHIRRANQFDIGDYGYESDDYYLKSIDLVLKEYKDIEKIKIYSQGNIDNFSKFNYQLIEFHLNEPIEDTFSDLVFSNHFIMSKGSFSYTAALLNKNHVYYLPFWHPPLSTWKNLKI
jgi:hypothetical protein